MSRNFAATVRGNVTKTDILKSVKSSVQIAIRVKLLSGRQMKGSPCDSLRFKMLSHKGFIGTKISGAAPVSRIFALFFFFF